MSCEQFYVIFYSLFFITNINGAQIPKETQSSSIDFGTPKISGEFFGNQRSGNPFRSRHGDQNKIKITSKINEVNPCNGGYIKTNGTTCGLKEVMIGRCYEYQYVNRGLFLSNTTEAKNCTKLYELFETATRYRTHCDLNFTTYETYFAYALSNIDYISKAMFWSGTYAIAHAYSKQGFNYITLEDTLGAGVADGLRWCGKSNDTEGFDYVSCPRSCKDNPWADDAFWGLASKTFAQKVAGDVYLVLNGSRTDGVPAFRNTSYFAKYELPQLNRTGSYRVTKLTVLLLHSPDLNVAEKCGEKSLKDLEDLVRSYRIEYECKNSPDDLIFIMCGDDWQARECQYARQVLRQGWDKKLNGKANSRFHSMSFLFLVSTIINYFL